MRSRVYATVGRPSVRPSVCLSHRPPCAVAVGLLLWTLRESDIDRLPQQRQPNAGSATLLAHVGSWSRLVCFRKLRFMIRRNSTNFITANFLTAGSPSCPSTNSANQRNSLTQRINSYRWSGVILFHLLYRTPKGRTLLYSYQLSYRYTRGFIPKPRASYSSFI